MAEMRPVGRFDRMRWRSLAHLVACIALGVLAGVAWTALSPRATYFITPQMRATLSERSQAEIVGGDATFAIIMGLLGLALGILTWVWFHRRGWLLVLLAVLGPTVMALVAWQMGQAIGGSGLTERLAAAQPGDLVQTDLELHALGALAVAPFFAITPVMLLAAFWPERSVDAEPQGGVAG